MRKQLLAVVATLTLVGIVAVPAYAAMKFNLGTVFIKNGQASGTVTFYTEDETFGSTSVQDKCPGDGHWISARIIIDKDGQNDEIAYSSTRGHSCGYGESTGEFIEATFFDHQRARLKVCRYPTGSFEPTNCNYSSWQDNPYDD